MLAARGAMLAASAALAAAALWWRRRGVCTILPAGADGADGAGTADGVRGTIELRDVDGRQTLAVVRLRGLTPGLHGLHVHRCGDLSGPHLHATCEHYNPDQTSHGGALGTRRHRGDFGNVEADADGHCHVGILADVRLEELVGRAFVLHQGADDLGKGGSDASLATGNSGARIAGGLIKYA